MSAKISSKVSAKKSNKSKKSKEFSMIPIKHRGGKRGQQGKNKDVVKKQDGGAEGGVFKMVVLDRDFVEYYKEAKDWDSSVQEAEINYIKLMEPYEHYFQKNYTRNLPENLDIGYGVQHIGDPTSDELKYLGYKVICPIKNKLGELEDGYHESHTYKEDKTENFKDIDDIFHRQKQPFKPAFATTSSKGIYRPLNLGNSSYFSVLTQMLSMTVLDPKSNTIKGKFVELINIKIPPQPKLIYNVFHKYVVPKLANYRPGEQYIGDVLDRLQKEFPKITHKIVSINMNKDKDMDKMSNVLEKINNERDGATFVSIKPFKHDKLVRSGWMVEPTDLEKLDVIVVHTGKCKADGNNIIMGGHYKCYNKQTSGKWFEFNDDYWKEIGSNVELQNKIKDETNYKILAFVTNEGVVSPGGSPGGGANKSNPTQSDEIESKDVSDKIIGDIETEISEYKKELDHYTSNLITEIKNTVGINVNNSTSGGGKLQKHISRCIQKRKTVKKQMVSGNQSVKKRK